MGCQEHKGGRIGNWSDLVWIVHGQSVMLLGKAVK
jgi:hypothetical protein